MGSGRRRSTQRVIAACRGCLDQRHTTMCDLPKARQTQLPRRVHKVRNILGHYRQPHRAAAGVTTTNLIDSLHAGVRQHTRRVSRWKEWRDGGAVGGDDVPSSSSAPRRCAPSGWPAPHGAKCPGAAGMNPGPARRGSPAARLPGRPGDEPKGCDTVAVHPSSAPPRAKRGWTEPGSGALGAARTAPRTSGDEASRTTRETLVASEPGNVAASPEREAADANRESERNHERRGEMTSQASAGLRSGPADRLREGPLAAGRRGRKDARARTAARAPHDG